MKKIFLLGSLCIFTTTVMSMQQQETPCDPCERFQYYKLRAEKTATVQEFDELWAKAVPYRNECAQKVKQINEKNIKYVETGAVCTYLMAGGVALKIIIDLIRK